MKIGTVYYQSCGSANLHLCAIKKQSKNQTVKQFNMNSKFVLAVVGILVTIASVAKPASIAVTSSSEDVFNVHYTASQSGTVKVTILNENNQFMFSEALVNVASFVRPYNFSELTEGVYTIVVEGNGVKQAEKVKYEKSKVVSYAMVSEVENQKNKYLLNVTSSGTQNVTVRIYSNEGSLLHEQTMEVKESASVIYDLNKVKTNNDTITFEITTGGVSTQTINL